VMMKDLPRAFSPEAMRGSLKLFQIYNEWA
jgi:hypothetical protein